MRIKYLSCDGETVVEEPITKAEMFRSMLDPDVIFMRCTRPNGDIFEIYLLDHIEEISEG